MNLMNSVLHDYLDKFVLVFLDDILIYSINEEEHLVHLQFVLQRLSEHKLYGKLSKCAFFVEKVHYLGHIISKEGIAVDPEKIRAIVDWSIPRNVSKVRSFMGLVGYYRRFVEGFSKIANPITSLQRKGKRFVWTKQSDKAFQILKEKLTTTPILRVPNPNGHFIVVTNASIEGLGGVIIQDEGVVAYEYRKLKTDEVNYAPS